MCVYMCIYRYHVYIHMYIHGVEAAEQHTARMNLLKVSLCFMCVCMYICVMYIYMYIYIYIYMEWRKRSKTLRVEMCCRSYMCIQREFGTYMYSRETHCSD